MQIELFVMLKMAEKITFENMDCLFCVFFFFVEGSLWF